MASEPNVRVGVPFGHIVVQVACREVVMTLLTQALDQACRVAGVCVGHAVANLLPAILSSLATTTRSEQVVVQLIIACSLGTIEDRHRRALEANHNCAVVFVRKDVSAQAVLLPTKVFGIIEASAHFLPFSSTVLVRVSVVCHPREAQDRLFIGDVWSCYFVVRPGRRRQSRSFSMNLSIFEQGIDSRLLSVRQPLDCGR